MEEKKQNGETLLEMNELDLGTVVRIRAPVTVLGTGDFGKALGQRLSLVGYDVVMGSRSPGTRSDFLSLNYNVMSIDNALNHSDIVFLAIPRDGYDQMAVLLRKQVNNKIVVDVSNRTQASRDGPSHAEYLASLLPGARVVKGFNVVSAWALENDIYGGSRLVDVCGDDPEAKREVMEIARALQFIAVDQGSLKMAQNIEDKPLELFPSWRVALKMFAVLYIILLLFGILGKLIKKRSFHDFPLRIFSVLNAFSTLGLLDMVYLPGCIAAFLQLAYGTKYRRFPRWLDAWMKSRKQLGLIALALAAMHGCMSALYWSPEYKSRLYQHTSITIGNVTLVQYKMMYAQGEAFLSLGVLALTSLCILGITSLPTVLNRMSWREWNFVQSGVGYFALVCALLHFIIFSYDTLGEWTVIIIIYPTTLVVIFGFIVIILRLVLLLPCHNNKVKKIRRGLERKDVVV